MADGKEQSFGLTDQKAYRDVKGFMNLEQDAVRRFSEFSAMVNESSLLSEQYEALSGLLGVMSEMEEFADRAKTRTITKEQKQSMKHRLFRLSLKWKDVLEPAIARVNSVLRQGQKKLELVWTSPPSLLKKAEKSKKGNSSKQKVVSTDEPESEDDEEADPDQTLVDKPTTSGRSEAGKKGNSSVQPAGSSGSVVGSRTVRSTQTAFEKNSPRVVEDIIPALDRQNEAIAAAMDEFEKESNRIARSKLVSAAQKTYKLLAHVITMFETAKEEWGDDMPSNAESIEDAIDVSGHLAGEAQKMIPEAFREMPEIREDSDIVATWMLSLHEGTQGESMEFDEAGNPLDVALIVGETNKGGNNPKVVAEKEKPNEASKKRQEKSRELQSGGKEKAPVAEKDLELREASNGQQTGVSTVEGRPHSVGAGSHTQPVAQEASVVPRADNWQANPWQSPNHWVNRDFYPNNGYAHFDPRSMASGGVPYPNPYQGPGYGYHTGLPALAPSGTRYGNGGLVQYPPSSQESSGLNTDAPVFAPQSLEMIGDKTGVRYANADTPLIPLPRKVLEVRALKAQGKWTVKFRSVKDAYNDEEYAAKDLRMNFAGQSDEVALWLNSLEHYYCVESVDDRKKFARLMKTLKGPALTLASKISPDRMDALDELIDRMRIEFGRVRTLKKEVLAKIRSLQPVKSSTNYQAMKSLRDDLTTHLQCLMRFGANPYADDDLRERIMQKVPAEMTQSYHRERKTFGNLQGFLDWLDEWILSLSLNETSRGTEQKLPEPKKKDDSTAASAAMYSGSQPSGKKPPSSQGNFQAQSQSGNQNQNSSHQGKNQSQFSSKPQGAGQNQESSTSKKTGCRICDGDHYNEDCDVLKTTPKEERYQVCADAGLHFMCLRRHPKPKEGEGTTCRRQPQRCGVDNCNGYHHPMLHGCPFPDSLKKKRPKFTGTSRKAEAEASPAVVQTVQAQGGEPTLMGSTTIVSQIGQRTDYVLRLLNVFVRKAEGGVIKRITAMLDGGAMRSFLCKKVAQRLGLDLSEYPIMTESFHGKKEELVSDIDFEISGDGENWFSVSGAATKSGLAVSGPKVSWSTWAEDKPEFQDLGLQDVDYREVRMILGLPQEELMSCQERIKSADGAYKAEQCALGWTISGPVSGFDKEFSQTQMELLVMKISMDPYDCVRIENPTAELNRQMHMFTAVEGLGVLKIEDELLSRSDRADVRFMKSKVKEIEGHLEVPMLKKDELPTKKLPPSKPQALSRLRGLKRKLSKNPKLKELYEKGLAGDEAKEYIRELTPEEVAGFEQGQHWYLPHMPVFHPDKPEKCRRVMDAAAMNSGVSLNSLLKLGPNNLTPLLGVLMRFRLGKFAMNADVAEMFSQIRVPTSDQAMLMFLWEDSQTGKMKTYTNTRHIFGAKCSPAIAVFALNEAVALAQPELKGLVERSVYMDDFFYSCNDVEQMKQLPADLMKVLGKYGFSLQKWVANSGEILATIPEEAKAPSVKALIAPGEKDLPDTKVLGVGWSCGEDTLQVTTRMKEWQDVNTLAGMLSAICSVFDPLGLMGPIIFAGKCIIRDVWAEYKDWNKEIGGELLERFRAWAKGLESVLGYQVPRWYGFAEDAKLDIHAFGDASTLGYGGCVYLACRESKRSSLVMSKSRVAKRDKTLTIPRMELLALVLAARMAETTIAELSSRISVVKVALHTDSMVVYYQVRSEGRRFDTFVGNKLGEIHMILEQLAEFNPEVLHVPTDLNPADLVSRGVPAEEFGEHADFWNQGPAFILEDESKWPRISKSEERKVLSGGGVFMGVLGLSEPDAEKNDDDYVGVDGYLSEEEREFIGKHEIFQEYLRLKSIRSGGMGDELMHEEYEALRREEIKQVQRKVFGKEIEKCIAETKGQPDRWFVPRAGPLRDMQLWVDEHGVLRLITRLDYGKKNFPEEMRRPLILPARHCLTELIIRDAHHAVLHGGYKSTRGKLAEHYHILRYANSIQRVLSRCRHCVRRRPYLLLPPTAPLHANRLAKGDAIFSRTGVDHFGPFMIHDKGSGNKWKEYGLIFMCLTTRAIVLDAVPNIDTECFVNSISRFMDENGEPNKIHSDNGGSFKRFNKCPALPTSVQRQIEKFMARRFKIDMRFNPPGAPHWGGSWERMIQEVKKLLITGFQGRQFSHDSFVTYLKRAQCILNQRPLAFDDDGIPISPWQIMNPASAAAGGFPEGASYVESYREVQEAVETFWKRWDELYIRFIGVSRNAGMRRFVNLAVGDHVLLRDKEKEAKPSKWEPLTVLEVFPGNDGLVRKVKAKHQGGRISEYDVTRLAICEGAALTRYLESPTRTGTLERALGGSM